MTKVTIHHFKYVGLHKEFPFDIDLNSWPGRELLWMWTHPAISIVLVLLVIGEIVLGLWSCWT